MADIYIIMLEYLTFRKNKTMRGDYFNNAFIKDHRQFDLTGCVFYKCYPPNIEGAINVEPITSFEGMDLEEGDFSFFDFGEGANFKQAKLQDSTFRRSNLMWSNFIEADLKTVDLSEANLSEADLTRANLEGADLQEAYLVGAYLVGANLKGANLSEANVEGADFEGAFYNKYTRLPYDIGDEQLSRMIKL